MVVGALGCQDPGLGAVCVTLPERAIFLLSGSSCRLTGRPGEPQALLFLTWLTFKSKAREVVKRKPPCGLGTNSQEDFARSGC